MVRNPSTTSTPRIVRTAISGADNPALHLHSALKAQLLDLPFAAFASCIGDLLRAEGYTDVRLAGRVTYLGRNKEGGYDIEAYLPSPLGRAGATGGVLRRKVLVQIKQFPHTVKVYQRTLDALRGACLRTGAIEAVLITTSDFSPVVRNTECVLRREAGSSSFAPVHLLSGDALVERLIAHRIGVQETTTGHLVLDPAYFNHLEAEDTKANGAARKAISNNQQSPPSHRGGIKARISRTRTEVTLTLPLDGGFFILGKGKNVGGRSHWRTGS